MIVKVTVPEGTVGVRELAPTVAVKITCWPTATEVDGDAVITSVAGSGLTVWGSVAAVDTVKLGSPE